MEYRRFAIGEIAAVRGSDEVLTAKLRHRITAQCGTELIEVIWNIEIPLSLSRIQG